MDFSKEKLLLILVNRLVVLFFLMCVFTIFLYAAGTVQGFIDTTQLSLLSFYVFMGIFLILAAILGTILESRRFFKSKKMRYLFRAAGYIIAMFLSAASVLAAMFIITISGGNNG